jgi:bacterioferritin
MIPTNPSHPTGNGGTAPRESKTLTLDLDAVRARARQGIEEGAVTRAYGADRETILRLLNDSLATELVCTLRYRRHYFMSATMGGIGGFAIETELLEHANQELEHADRLAERIVQLGGEPEFDPVAAARRSHTQYVAGKDLTTMLIEDLVAERIAIDTYDQIIRFIGDKDPTTRRLFEEILAQEEEHADEVADFLRRLKVEGKVAGVTR